MTSNGVGPAWFPAPVRQALTWLSGLFFHEAAWHHHDRGYARGHPDRATCDLKFLKAMLRDASRTETASRVWACCFLAGLFWVSVRVFGWTAYRRRMNG
jgi:hypothetical protein